MLNRGTIVLSGPAAELLDQPDGLEAAYLGDAGTTEPAPIA